jgi:hypothetical protein
LQRVVITVDIFQGIIHNTLLVGGEYLTKSAPLSVGGISSFHRAF